MKKILSLLLALTLVFSLFSMCGISTTAAEAGTLVSNAIALSNNVWHTKYWTSNNYRLNCYNKIVVPSRGYITFTAQKPFDDEGELCSYDFTLYNPQGQVVWAADTSPQKDSFNEYYVYKIGLAAGTYYMNIDPSFYVYSYSAPIPSKYKFKFTKTNYWEVESNNDKSTATALTLGKSYTGVYTEESYSTSYDDYYKVKLTKGKFYKLVIGNYNELKAGTTLLDFFDPNDNEISLYDLKESGKSRYLIFKAQYSGWYYFKLRNDGNSAGVEYTIKFAQHIKKTQTISAPSKITRYGDSKFKIKASAKTDITFGENSNIIDVDSNGEVYVDGYGESTIKVTAKETDIYKSATKKITVTIYPKKPSISKITNSNTGDLEVTWDCNYDASGYQLQIATNSKFTKGKKTYNLNDGWTNLKDITNLKKGQKYYFRLRTYVTVSGKKYYSPWSKTMAKTVTVKVSKVNIAGAYSWSRRELEVNWYQATYAEGYQVQVATNSKFTKNKKTKTINGNSYSDDECEFTKLKSGKKYYTRVRAFVKTGGKTYYGKWSKVKNTVIY